ncbi:RRQRL motif-containing zinc-binding protein [Streptomyces sp. NPDC058200]|uniref:RRQRL motif-containing zinc-binding protein n=1 Tax=Streptomyces sp. NPDC058200 TaxID=3346378 RepID=UPI0036E44CEE
MGGRFWDPDGSRYGIPTFPFRMAPDGLATRRQLRTSGLRPGGQPVAGQLLWFSNRYRHPGSPPIRAAYLYRVDLAKPVRPMTPAKWAALARANAARRVCPECLIDAGYRIPTSLGMCVTCAYPGMDLVRPRCADVGA